MDGMLKVFLALVLVTMPFGSAFAVEKMDMKMMGDMDMMMMKDMSKMMNGMSGMMSGDSGKMMK